MAEAVQVFCIGSVQRSWTTLAGAKYGLARDLGDCLQSRNVLFGTSGDSYGIDNKVAVNYRKDVSCRITAGLRLSEKVNSTCKSKFHTED